VGSNILLRDIPEDGKIDLISASTPLRQTARRAGWVGSNILLRDIPEDGKIDLISASTPRDPDVVRQEWRKVEFLGADARALGGWGADVLSCVREMESETGYREFTLQAFYSHFTESLSRSHPDNNNVEAKIRQQLQVLRDGGILEFLGRGRYRVIA
jgi:type II restriction enzyme